MLSQTPTLTHPSIYLSLSNLRILRITSAWGFPSTPDHRIHHHHHPNPPPLPTANPTAAMSDPSLSTNLTESGITIPSDSENYDANNELSTSSPASSSTSPLILYKPPTLWGLLRGAAINLLLPFVNGLMLGFGELVANEAAYRLGWSGTKVCFNFSPTILTKRPRERCGCVGGKGERRKGIGKGELHADLSVCENRYFPRTAQARMPAV